MSSLLRVFTGLCLSRGRAAIVQRAGRLSRLASAASVDFGAILERFSSSFGQMRSVVLLAMRSGGAVWTVWSVFASFRAVSVQCGQ